MGWATPYIDELRQNKVVQFRPKGESMKGKINSGQLVTVTPLQGDEPVCVNDIVLCSVRGSQYLHLVKDVKGSQILIGNNRGKINGWITRGYIYGKCTQVSA